MERNLRNPEWNTKLWLGLTVGVSLLLGSSSSHLGAAITQSPASPLVFRIAVKPKNCRGSSLTVDAELINQGSESVAIDRRMSWYRSMFKYSTIASDGRIKGEIKTSNGDFGEAARDGSDYLILQPGQSYKASRSFSIEDEFFNSAETFSVQMTYGQFFEASTNQIPLFIGTVKSNEVEFKVTNCKRKQHSAKR